MGGTRDMQTTTEETDVVTLKILLKVMKLSLATKVEYSVYAFQITVVFRVLPYGTVSWTIIS